MKTFTIASAALTATSLFASSVSAALDPIVIKGQHFFYQTNGSQFFIKGVAYQQDVTGNDTSSTSSYSDPLADEAGCARDIPILKELQTNTIRVYAIDPTQDHSACMQMLQDNDIYVVSDLSQPDESINRDSPEWNTELYARYTSVVDALANYTNVLGFFAGNEVSNAENNTAASEFVKAAVRDTKAYIKAKGYRTIGVGYATDDDATIRVNMADYFNCGNQTDAIDFWGYNVYSWCGASTYELSGYEERTQELSNYSIPAFFAEYGCNTVQPRQFTEVQALFGDNMTSVWSGGIVYMYFQEANDYGLVTVSGSSVSKLSDFTSYSNQIATVSPSSINSASYTASNSPQACPATGSAWAAQATPLPPSPNANLCECMYDSLSCVVAADTSEDDYATLFNQVCGYGTTICAGINTNSSEYNGVFGAYGMCNSTQQLAYAFNKYAAGQTNNPSACGFGGSATTKAATSAAGTCATLVEAVGTAGTGSVSSNPTATAGSGSGSSASSSGSSSSSSSKGAAAGVLVPGGSFGSLGAGLYAIVAVVSGVAMILL